MSNLGSIKTQKSIDQAITQIKEWLNRLDINGLTVDIRYDARQNIALLRFNYKDKEYEFRSTSQGNCRLNMWAIARVMEFKVRASIMGIEDFEKSMNAYLALEDKSGFTAPMQKPSNETNYVILGISPLASNDEIRKKYKELMKGFHPDMALSEIAKKEFERRAAEINQAYSEIQKERGL